jgi:hypothetical protein
MKRIMTIVISLLFSFSLIFGQGSEKVIYSDSWGEAGISIENQSSLNLDINFSISSFQFNDILVDGEFVKTIQLPGVFLPNNEGAPDLPGMARYIALPQGATAMVSIVASRTETFNNIDIVPAFRIPKVYDEGPLVYSKDESIYSKNAYYPENPVIISELQQIRGVDAVLLGITPFQYNPVTKDLIVYRDIKIEVSFEGGNGHFGEDRLRSRWWDPILRDMILNQSEIQEIEYTTYSEKKTPDFEYVIIVPDNPDFIAWADSIKQFRTLQGIRTGVFTLADIGGNNTTLIENFIDNAYNTWAIPPAAVLLMADYGTGPATGNGITSPMVTYSGETFVSDNVYACVGTSDYLADVVLARMTAQNNTHLQTMVNKALDYERNPPTNANFYAHPVTAMGYQSDRWFQICSEIINGFFEYALNKQPVRENAGYTNGSAPSSWSTNTNTPMIINYFGPTGLGYIPATPSHLTDWGGNATRVNNDINSGAFLVQHRDHGGETGWSEPSYYNGNLSGLNNNDLPYIFSVNCLTGKFDISGDCFAEAFHRQPQRALGIIAATEVSYSFVNDAYAWGMYDNMWPQFMPAFGTTPASRGILPAFANAAGKYFLQQSSWPYNPGSKEITCYLFHSHGDAFTQLYSEMPQQLTVNHSGVLFGGQTSFSVAADLDALICLTVNGEIIGIGTGNGGSVDISIPVQVPGNMMQVTITKQNYYRYEQKIPVVAASGPYTYCSYCAVNDSNLNNNGIPEAGETVELQLSFINIGVDNATNVTGTISCSDTMVSLLNTAISLGNINVSDTITVDSLILEIDPTTPHLHSCMFNLHLIADSAGIPGGYIWDQNIAITIREGAEIQIAQTQLDFPNTIVGSTFDINLNIDNNGVDTLYITDAATNLTNYSVAPLPLKIGPGAQSNLIVTFAPTDTISYNDILTITNSDPVNFVQTIPINGEGMSAPDIFSQDSLRITILPADTQQVQFTIENVGLGELIFNAQIASWDPNGKLEVLGGEDNYGHKWKDSDEPGGPTFDWIDISSSGTQIAITGDNATSGAINIGFPVTYYGTEYNEVRVCTNGWLSFTSFLFSPANQPLPNNYAPRTMIAPLWDDLNFQANSRAYYEQQGNKFIVLFENVYCLTGQGPYTFEVILYDNEVIKFQYLSLQNLVNDYTVGIQNYAKNDGLTIAYNTNYLHDNMAILISINSWVQASPLSGLIPRQSSMDLDLTFTTTDLELGDYWACLQIESNDPDETVYSVPIHMIVSNIVGVEDKVEVQIEGFYLSQNNPNPFNPTTTISYNIEQADKVELVVYNMLGQKVRTLVNRQQTAKMYRVVWDGHDDHGAQVASGIYIYRLKAGENVAINKMIFLK